MESSTNSPMGSHHWFHTLMAFILHTGEYLEIHGADATEHTMKTWGKGIKERAQELVEGFKLIGTPEVLNRFEIVNQCEDALQLKIAVLSLADTEGMIKGRRRPFKAARMAGFVEGVIAGELPPECLTREFGIRQQALYIKYYEDAQRQVAESAKSGESDTGDGKE